MTFLVTQDGPVCSLSRVIDALGGAVKHVWISSLAQVTNMDVQHKRHEFIGICRTVVCMLNEL